MSEEAVTKSVTGRCEEVTEKNGWTSFAIDVGTQYPVRLSTKLDPLIELGRAASKDGGVFTWTFKESQGGENPHKPGTFYTNRYLSGVEKSDGSVATPGAAPQARTYTPDLKDRMIVRQSALKAAAEIVASRPQPSPPDYDAALETMKVAQRFETWVYRDIEIPETLTPALSEHDDSIPY